MKQLSVLAIPAHENRNENPYNHILYSGLEAQGVTVKGYDLKTLWKRKDYDIVHLHWPENFLWATSKAGAYKAYFIFWLKLWFLKFTGKKVVWTVHNQKPHEGKWAAVSAKAYALLYRKADGFISLTKSGAAEVEKKTYYKDVQKVTVVPHPHYRGYYANGIGKKEGREKLRLPQDKFVFLFIGQVRAYKNVVGLVNAFKALNDDTALLVIAGRVHEDVAAALQAAIGNEKRILLFPSFISDDELQVYLNAADLVVTPFTKILNSGSVFLNLSFSRPTLVPAANGLLELQKQVGDAWIKTFDGELSATHLQRCRDEMEKQQKQETKPDLSGFDWPAVAGQTKSFYQSLME